MTKVNFHTNGMDVLVYFMWVITDWLIFGIEGLGIFRLFFQSWLYFVPVTISVENTILYKYPVQDGSSIFRAISEIVENCVLILIQN